MGAGSTRYMGESRDPTEMGLDRLTLDRKVEDATKEQNPDDKES